MSPPLTVLRADPRGAAAATLLAALTRKLNARYGAGGDGLLTPDDAALPRSTFVVAFAGDRPVACGALRPMADPATGEIKRMDVAPAARGRGVGGQVLAALESAARAFDYRRLLLETGTLQPEAMRLYEKSGYVRRPCYAPYVDNPHSVCYEKQHLQEESVL